MSAKWEDWGPGCFNGRRVQGTGNPRSVLTPAKVRRAWKLLQKGHTAADAARRIGATTAAVATVRSGQTWSHVTQDLGPLPPPAKGRRGVGAKLTDDQAREVYRRAWAGENQVELAAELGVNHSTVSYIKTRRTYRDATAKLHMEKKP